MPLYGGIDLHANNSVVVLLNEQDQVIYQRRLANHLPDDSRGISPLPGRHQRRGGGVHLQLVLARRWLDGGRLPGPSRQPCRDAAVQWAEVYE